MGLMDFFMRRKASPAAAAEINIFSSLDTLGLSQDASLAQALYQFGTIQACLEKIAWTTAGLPWRYVGSDGGQADHPLLKRPNPDMTWQQFIVTAALQYGATGDFYALLVRRTQARNSPVIAIWPLQSALMNVKVDQQTGQVTEYVYGNAASRRRFTYRAEDGQILHLRRPSADSPNNGRSILPAAIRVAQVIEMLSEKLYEGLQGGMNAPAIIALRHVLKDNVIGPDALKSIRDAMNDYLAGGAKAGRLFLLSDVEADKLDIPRTAIDASDMDTRTELRREVCFLMGVPPVLLGLKDDSTYNNYQTALMAFYTETVLPMYARPLAEALTAAVFGADGGRLDVDTDAIPVLQEGRTDTMQALERVSYMTINEKRAEMGLPPVDGGNVLLISAAMQPMDAVLAQGEPMEGKDADLWSATDARDADGSVTEFPRKTATCG